MESMTPLVRAAQALHKASQEQGFIRDPLDVDTFKLFPRGLKAWEELSEGHRRVYFEATRAVLAAIREPSAQAIGWGSDAVEELAAENKRAAAQSAWRAMIDALLTEEG
jgi:hypothetical protein